MATLSASDTVAGSDRESHAAEATAPAPLPANARSINRKFDRDWLRQLILRHAHSHPTMPHDLVDKALVVAPMVDASDLPYRLLARRYNSSLCFTPMIHARMFIEKKGYRAKFWREEGMPSCDRPLIAQFCGYEKHVLLRAMKVVEPHVDGVDINCGCPQNIAKRGRYGAYLMEEDEGDRIVDIVRHLSQNLNVPVSVKVRLLPSGLEDSLALYRRLVDAGAAMLTIHGRTRLQKQRMTGHADWDAIREVVRCVGGEVPVMSNGSISNLDDVRRCLEYTHADGIMSSEAILEYPPLFSETNVSATDFTRTGPGRLQLARDYLELCEQYPPSEGGQGSGMKCIRAHLHRFLHADLQEHVCVRDAVVKAFTMEAAHNAVQMVDEIHKQQGHEISKEQLSWYVRHRREWDGSDDDDEKKDAYGEEKKATTEEEDEDCGLCEDAAESMGNMFGTVVLDDGGGDY